MTSIVEPKVRVRQESKVRLNAANFWYVQTTDIKLSFAGRVHELCDDMGIPAAGRQTALAKVFNVTPNTARKWLQGIGMPELDRAIAIAMWADTNVLWLLQGVTPKRGDKIDAAPGELIDGVSQLPADQAQQVFDFKESFT